MIQVVRHGHSFVELLSDNGSVLVDPFITGNPKCDLTLEQVKEKNIIAICITHGHGDHIGDTMEIAREKNIPIVCEYGVAQYFQEEENYENCVYGSIGGTLRVNDTLHIKLFAATHGGRILKTDRYCTPAGMLITYEGKKVYHAGDTSLMSDMQMLSAYKVDVACLPIDGVYNMDMADAAIAAKFIKATTVFPIHYDTWAPIRVDAVEFARRVMADAVSVPKVLTPGQYVVVE